MSTDRIIAIIGVVIAVAALIQAARYRRIGPSPARLYYSATEYPLSFPILEQHGLLLTYDGDAVEEARIVAIEMWNDGGAPIDQSSFSADDPLRLHLKDGSRIFRARLLGQSRDSNRVRLGQIEETKRHEIEVSFSYLDPTQGARIELLYQRPRESRPTDYSVALVIGDAYEPQSRDLELLGSLKGVPKGFRRYSATRYGNYEAATMFLLLAVSAGLGVASALTLPAPWGATVFFALLLGSAASSILLFQRKGKDPRF